MRRPPPSRSAPAAGARAARGAGGGRHLLQQRRPGARRAAAGASAGDPGAGAGRRGRLQRPDRRGPDAAAAEHGAHAAGGDRSACGPDAGRADARRGRQRALRGPGLRTGDAGELLSRPKRRRLHEGGGGRRSAIVRKRRLVAAAELGPGARRLAVPLRQQFQATPLMAQAATGRHHQHAQPQAVGHLQALGTQHPGGQARRGALDGLAGLVTADHAGRHVLVQTGPGRVQAQRAARVTGARQRRSVSSGRGKTCSTSPASQRAQARTTPKGCSVSMRSAGRRSRPRSIVGKASSARL
ncbi:hypothetical protein Ddc_19728 [Ditylenchus destructor]|nr:hypothetical protein Ddc_19728 [Ditylenchus destructor]